MRSILLFLFSIICFKSSGQRIPRIEEVIYDKNRNIIASLGYFGTYGHVETVFRDTVTNIRYKLDESHHFVTALNKNGDTLWNVDPYVVLREQYTIQIRELKYENLNYEKLPSDTSKTDTDYTPKVLNDSTENIDTSWVTVTNLNRPTRIVEMKFGKCHHDSEECIRGETVLYIKSDGRTYGFLDLKNGKHYFIGQD